MSTVHRGGVSFPSDREQGSAPVMRVVRGFILALLTLAPAAWAAEPLSIEDAAKSISDQIVATLRPQTGKLRPRVAVQELASIEGRTSNLGRLLAEEILTSLFTSGDFSIVERRHLLKIMEEKGLAEKGITRADPKLLEEIGRILGADAIVAGTISVTSGTRTVTARVISTKDGEILAVARATIQDEAGLAELERTTAMVSSISKSGSTEAPSQVASPAAPRVVLFEDFSQVEHGLLPSGWVAPNSVLVKKSSIVAGNALTSNAPGNYSLYVPVVSFPQDFRLELKLKQDLKSSVSSIKIGSLEFKFVPQMWGEASGQVSLGKNTGRFTSTLGKLSVITIERKNTVVKFFVNGEQVLIDRQPIFSPPLGITLMWQRDGEVGSSFYSLKIEAL